MKKVLAFLLVLTLCLSLVPISALAEEETPTVDTDMSVEGTTSVGELVANSLDGYSEQTAEACHITDIVMTGTSAAVSFETDRASDVVVAVYTEDGVQMLGSGKSTVTAEATSAVVAVEIDEMPEYYVVGAYLLDAETHEPLCECFLNQMYTQKMQELLASDVNDYDPERVVNLDDDPTTNFVVFGEDVLLSEEAQGTNEVTDNGDGTYTITNADADYKALKAGDTFSYTYADGTMLIVVVKSVKVSGSTVTVTEDTEASLEDVFDYVKIEGDSYGAEVQVDENSLGEGVELIDPAQTDGATEHDESYSRKLAFSIGRKFVNTDHATVEVKGTLEYAFTVRFKAYISMSYQYISFTMENALSVSVEFGGKLENSIPLIYCGISPVPGVYIDLTPEFVFEVSGKLSWKGEIKSTVGYGYDSDVGFMDLGTNPSTSSKVEFSGKLFVGLQVEPKIVIVSEKIMRTGMEARVGIELSAKETIYSSSTKSIHDCVLCFDGDKKAVASVSVKLELFNKKVDLKATLVDYSKWINDFYCSVDYGEFEWGMTCPHIRYMVEITATDEDGNPIENANIMVINKNKAGEGEDGEDGVEELRTAENDAFYPITNSEGKATFYIPNGEYTLYAGVGFLDEEQTFTVHNETKKLNVTIETAGTCGKNLTWKLDKDGTLTISGTGAMTDWEHCSAPWSGIRGNIKSVVILDGVTTIGGEAFAYCGSLTSVEIPDSVTYIGNFAFEDCTSLTSVEIPDSVTTIGGQAFSYCDSLTSVEIGDSVTRIWGRAFAPCDKLDSISVSASNKYYTSKDNVLFNKAMTEVVCYPAGKQASSYTIPSSVTTIGGEAFAYCGSLTSVEIPDSVTYIGYFAFENCTSLTSVEIPDSVTYIGGWTFYSCTSLTSVEIPDSVTYIGKCAFCDCDSLTDVYYAGTQAQWSKIDIGGDNGCLTSATIHYNSTGLDGIAASDGEPVEEETVPVVEETPAPAEEMPSGEVTASAEPVEDAALVPILEEPDIIAASAAKYTGSVTAEGAQSVARFTGLVPGAAYVMLAVADTAAADLLAPSNLLFIVQGTAGDSGTLSFSYIPRLASVGGVVLYGESTKNLKDALVTVSDDLTVLVSYEGEMLLEERDFTVAYDVNDNGNTTVTVTGRDDYAGSRTVTVKGSGDANGDGFVNALDLVYVMKWLAGDKTGVVSAALDINGDGLIDLLDLVKLMKIAAT